MSITATEARALYRAILRELPRRNLASSTPLQRHIRGLFSATSSGSTELDRNLREAKQHVQFAQAQRQYVTLLERYNPGLSMEDEDRVKLTARRVGMELPKEFVSDQNNQ